MRLLIKRVSLLSNFKPNSNALRNFAKALSQEQVSAPSQETLTGRILLYFDNERPNPPKSTTEIIKNFRRNVNHLNKLSTSEIVSFSSVLTAQNLTRNELLFVLKELDAECYSRLSKLTSGDILKLLNVYVNIIPSRITEFNFYKHSIKVLYESLPQLSKKDFLQLIFYVGLKKKTLESQDMLRHCMRNMGSDFINNLTSEELCIICNATFKTSTKLINKNLLGKVRSHINDNLSVLKDCALFVTLVKTLRHNRYQDDNLLSSISCTVLFNKTFAVYSFPVICHVLALFADYFYYEEKLFQFFINKCMEQLNKSSFVSKELHLTQQLRGKDIKRFLWILSMFSDLKLVTQSDIKNVIIPKVIKRIEAGEFSNDFDSLIDITLYLWMLHYRSEELMPYVFTGRKSHVGSKSNLRLNLLLQTISIEKPDLLKKIPIKPVSIPSNVYSSYQLSKRPVLQRVLRNLNRMKELGLNRFELSQEIPHLNIVGITGYRNQTDKAVYIEVLDDYTRIRNVEDVPVGLMALKLRLLDQLEEGVLMVSQREIEDMTDSELNEYLLDEVKLIC